MFMLRSTHRRIVAELEQERSLLDAEYRAKIKELREENLKLRRRLDQNRPATGGVIRPYETRPVVGERPSETHPAIARRFEGGPEHFVPARRETVVDVAPPGSTVRTVSVPDLVIIPARPVSQAPTDRAAEPAQERPAEPAVDKAAEKGLAREFETGGSFGGESYSSGGSFSSSSDSGSSSSDGGSSSSSSD